MGCAVKFIIVSWRILRKRGSPFALYPRIAFMPTRKPNDKRFGTKIVPHTGTGVLGVNRTPTRYGFRTGTKGRQCSVNRFP